MTNCCIRVAGNSNFINFVHSSGKYSAIFAATRHGGETLEATAPKVAYKFMTKRYKICSIVYSFILIFGILFMLTILGASGHRIKFKFEDYLIPIYAVVSVVLVFYLPKISSQSYNLKKLLQLVTIILLLVSLYFAIKNLFEILSENLIVGFVIFALATTSIFIVSIILLVGEIIKMHKAAASNSRHD